MQQNRNFLPRKRTWRGPEVSLKRELLTKTELEVAAHRQGFTSLDDVDRAMLETGGAITFVAREPSPESARHEEVLARLDQLSQEIAALQKAVDRS